jgi:hypothetical protein
VHCEEPGELQLYDITSRVVAAFTLQGGRNVTISIAHLPAGVYQYIFAGKELKVKTGKLVLAP